MHGFGIATVSTNSQGMGGILSYDIWPQSPSCFLMKFEISRCGRCWYSTRTSWDKLIWSLSSLSRSVTQTTAARKASHMVSDANGLICSIGY